MKTQRMEPAALEKALLMTHIRAFMQRTEHTEITFDESTAYRRLQTDAETSAGAPHTNDRKQRPLYTNPLVRCGEEQQAAGRAIPGLESLTRQSIKNRDSTSTTKRY